MEGARIVCDEKIWLIDQRGKEAKREIALCDLGSRNKRCRFFHQLLLIFRSRDQDLAAEFFNERAAHASKVLFGPSFEPILRARMKGDEELFSFGQFFI